MRFTTSDIDTCSATYLADFTTRLVAVTRRPGAFWGII